MFSLKDKVAVVVGGASGIGRAIAEVFVQQEAIVCLVDLDKSVQKVAAGFSEQGKRAVAHECNVTHQQALVQVMAQVVAAYDRVDILVNSAGIAQVGKLENTGEEDFEKIFQVNVKGTYNGMYAAIPYMKKQQQGVILNIASIASSVGLPDRFGYSMTKGAVVSMTLSVAKDYVHEGIRCNCISPARVHTPFVDGFIQKNYPGKEKEMFEKLSKTQPIGRMAEPIEVAHLALYLCSQEASFITGCDYPIDGGFIKLNN
jgi:2-keto-3-deoxy-L-fuconate dehydrogenase